MRFFRDRGIAAATACSLTNACIRHVVRGEATLWRSLLLMVCLSLVTSSAQGAVIANWTFETAPPTTAGPLAADAGTGSATSVHAGAAAYSNPSGNGSAESWNATVWATGDYFQFQVSTVGQNGVSFSWDQTRSTAGPGQPSPTTPNFRLQYSTDGTNFTNVVDYLVPVVTWSSTTPDGSTQFSQGLSAVTALDNQSAVYFRLTAIQAPQNTGGQSRIDNIVISGSPIPEPNAVLGLGGAVLLAQCRRPRRH